MNAQKTIIQKFNFILLKNTPANLQKWPGFLRPKEA